ncbi:MULTISPECIES: DUF3137 domain-containing protein [unclassified Ruegeria]|uniref:DUF3137 domain-containing protein n=1 Tax=unclassified Ruegeria TaxID=2625375 RepID=UPI00148774D5|nr:MULTISPECIES: DUF3137 domain-containing protein [unclassified Ruegeria]
MAEYEFVESAPFEAGFAEVYEWQIAPFLRGKEEERQAAISRSMVWVKLIGAVSVVLAALASYYVHPLLGIFPLGFGGGAALIIYLERGSRISKDVSGFVRPILCKFLGNMDLHAQVPADFMPVGRLVALQILPKAERIREDTAITGTWRDTNYKLLKMSCSESYRDHNDDRKYRTLFAGIVLEIDCPVDMPRTVFVKDFGETLNKLYSWASRNTLPTHRWDLGLEDAEQVFEVYTDDPAQLGQYLKPQFAYTLTDIAGRFQGGKDYCAAAFSGRRFYLALSLPHSFLGFDVASAPLSEANDSIHRALRDLMTPRQIIDALHA